MNYPEVCNYPYAVRNLTPKPKLGLTDVSPVPFVVPGAKSTSKVK